MNLSKKRDWNLINTIGTSSKVSLRDCLCVFASLREKSLHGFAAKVPSYRKTPVSPNLWRLTSSSLSGLRVKPAMTIILVLIVLSTLTATSCKNGNPLPPWKWDEDPVELAEKPRFIWIDASANFPDFANSKDNIIRDLTIAKNAGFTDIVVDVRPVSGDALFATTVVDKVDWLGAWLPAGYTRIDRTATWDYLQAFIDAGHALGLKVHAGINTMTGGNITSLGQSGMLFRDASKRSWATQLLTETGIVNILDTGNAHKFFNPAHDDVQEYLCKMLEDLAAYRDLDGIILDRCRFDELHSDFSDYTRRKFEDYLGSTLQNWPGNVMRADIKTGSLPSQSNLPPLFKQWLEFRVKLMHDFMEKARTRVKEKNPEISFGVYVGGWYASYYGVGINWASKKYNTAASYSSWATSDYQKYGFADLMDVILIGAYAAPTNIYGTTEWTVQGFCALAKDKIKGDAPVIGGPDVGNGEWATASAAVVNQAITQSVDAAIHTGDGYFLFDMIHLKQKNQWQYVKEGIDKYLIFLAE